MTLLCFPFIFRGALDCGATTINEEMKSPRPTPSLRSPGRRCREAGRGRLPRAKSCASGRDYLIPKPCDRRRDHGDQAGVEGLGNEIIAAEAQLFALVSVRDRFRHLRPGERSDGVGRGDFISSLMVVAPQSSAPRKMNGKQRTLSIWFG